MSARPIAHPINFEREALYAEAFEGTGFGVIFQDDGAEGYLYATDEAQGTVYDSLLCYRVSEADCLKPGEPVFLVFNAERLRAGVHYHGQFQAVIDFAAKAACCRKGKPEPREGWCVSDHTWDPALTEGLKAEEADGTM